MKEANKKNKKKILLYYLILAACLLVIAAVTVTVIFTVDRKKSNLTIDSGITNPDDDNNDDNQGGDDNNGDNNQGGDDDNNDDKPTGSTSEMLLPVNTASVTCGYELAWDATLRLYQVHQGMDFEGEAGDNVFAALDGTVSVVVKDSLIGENYVTITHADGMKTTYKYMDVKEGLKVGDTVKRGDVIGTIAKATGMEMKQGDHLHFEVIVNGRTADPDTYLNIREK